jgi:cytoskeletal protein RodZ
MNEKIYDDHQLLSDFHSSFPKKEDEEKENGKALNQPRHWTRRMQFIQFFILAAFFVVLLFCLLWTDTKAIYLFCT